MKNAFLMLVLLTLVAGVTGAQTGSLWDYSLVYQGNRTNWEGDGEFRVSTGAVGLKVGQVPGDGFGFTWAFSTLAPFSLTFEDSDGESDTKFFNDANFGLGFGLRGGIAYAIRPVGAISVVPGIGWNFTYSNYSFNFPGGAASFTESSMGPFASVDVALRLAEQFQVRAGLAVAYEPFHSERTSNSGADEDYQNGLVARLSAGIRVPFQLGQLFSGRL